jgi:hypothetical protein
MKLVAFTLVLDGMPYIKKHLPVFKKTNLDWHWIIVHGAAMNNGSTRWCQPQEPRLSADGTTEYLRSLKLDLRGIDDKYSIDVLENEKWESKDEMVNFALTKVSEPCVLMEIDADEIWQPSQLEKIVQLFETQSDLSSIMFACRYYVGKNLILEGEHCYGDNDYEWLRAWRFTPGMTFSSHEPPVLQGESGRRMPKSETINLVGKFDHFAYAIEAQVKYKEQFYGYSGLLNQWKALQNHTEFPVSLSKFFSHVPEGEWPKVIKIEEPKKKSKATDDQFGVDWDAIARKAGQKEVPLIQRYQYCAYRQIGDVFSHRQERIKRFWPQYAWHAWNERRLRAVSKYHWVTWLGPASSAKTCDSAVFGLEYWLQAPDRTAVIACSTTMKMLRARIWSYIAHYHQSLPKGIGHVGELLDSVTRIRWKTGDDKNGIFGIAVEEGNIEEVVNNLIGIHTERVMLIIDEGQGIREAIMRATFNMAKNPRFDFLMMGNPDSLHSPLVRESEPINGWDSVTRGETEEWETLGGPLEGNGLCQFFDGRKSPADASPEERLRLPWLINKDWVANHLKGVSGNLNDPTFWAQAIGWPPPMGLESTLLDDSILTTFHCKDKAIWTEGFIRCAALDPAFNGGDKAILQFGKRGQALNDNDQKRWVIEGDEWLQVPIDSKSQRPIHYQIVDFVKVECTKRGIKPNEFSVAAAGEGGGLKSIFDKEWGYVNGIEEGGAPDEKHIIDEAGKTAKESYDTRASELQLTVREFAMADGIRGLSHECAFQYCSRRTFYRNGKWCVEPKTGSKGRTDEKGRPIRGYKQRMGHSPDHADAFSILVEHCRQRGAYPMYAGAAVTVQEPDNWRDEFDEKNYLKGYSYA